MRHWSNLPTKESGLECTCVNIDDFPYIDAVRISIITCLPFKENVCPGHSKTCFIQTTAAGERLQCKLGSAPRKQKAEGFLGAGVC